MTEQEKKEYIAESLEVDVETLKDDQLLEDFDTWDSVAVLSIIAIINEKFDRYPNAKEITACKTITDLMNAMN